MPGVAAEIVCLWPGAVVGIVANATSFRALKKLLLPVVGDLGLAGPSALSGAAVELYHSTIVLEPEFCVTLQLRTPSAEFPVSRYCSDVASRRIVATCLSGCSTMIEQRLCLLHGCG